MAAVWQTMIGFPTSWNPDVIASAIHQMQVSFITSLLCSFFFLNTCSTSVLWMITVPVILQLKEIIVNLCNLLNVSCVTLKIKGLFITLFSSFLNFISIFYNCESKKSKQYHFHSFCWEFKNDFLCNCIPGICILFVSVKVFK